MVLTGELPDNEVQFHATAIFASGGLVLSGDDLTKISEGKLAMLRKLQPPTGVAARFEDDSFTVGRIGLKNREVLAVLNFTDNTLSTRVRLEGRRRVKDFWDDSDKGVHEGEFEIKDLPPHSGRLLVCEVES